ncbi:MAG: DMT family transporter [Coriobacteriia bacterium]|nr:DMT family transporter [Coriobacteriia bacterium]
MQDSLKPVPDQSHSWKGYALATVAALCWATGGLTAKWLFTAEGPDTAAWRVPPLGMTIDPVVLSGARAFSAFAVLIVYLVVSRRYALRISRRELPFFALFGVVGLAGVHFTYFKAISHTNVATAILLEYLAPVLVLIVSVIFLGQQLTWTLPTGVGLSILGCALVVGAIGGDGLAVSPEGIAWGLASAVFFAAYSLMGRYAARRFSPWTTLVYGLGFASVFWMLYLRGPAGVSDAFATPTSTAAVLFIAVASTIIPFAAFLKALHYIDPTRATIVATLEPVIAGLVAFLALGETFGPVQILGGVLVLGAIMLIQAPGRAAPAQPFEVPPAS